MANEEKPKAAPQFFIVPAGTAPSECRGCKATIYWIVTEASRRMPVNCDVEGGVRPRRWATGESSTGSGRGISHFVDCPSAGQFRRKR